MPHFIVSNATLRECWAVAFRTLKCDILIDKVWHSKRFFVLFGNCMGERNAEKIGKKAEKACLRTQKIGTKGLQFVNNV